MVKESKVHSAVHEETDRLDKLSVAQHTYVKRMMAVFERADNFNFVLTVKNGVFRLHDNKDRNRVFTLYAEWSQPADLDLAKLETHVTYKEEEYAEKCYLDKIRLKATALSKLTSEECKSLNL
jgi:hypothetical protein